MLLPSTAKTQAFDLSWCTSPSLAERAHPERTNVFFKVKRENGREGQKTEEDRKKKKQKK